MEFQSYSGSTLRRSVRPSWPAGVLFVLTSSNIQAAVYDKWSVRESMGRRLSLVNTIPMTGGIPETQLDRQTASMRIAQYGSGGWS